MFETDVKVSKILNLIRVLYTRTRARSSNNANVTHCRSLNLASLCKIFRESVACGSNCLNYKVMHM